MCLHKLIINFTDIRNVCSIQFTNNTKIYNTFSCKSHITDWLSQHACCFLLNSSIHSLPYVITDEGANSHINVG